MVCYWLLVGLLLLVLICFACLLMCSFILIRVWVLGCDWLSSCCGFVCGWYWLFSLLGLFGLGIVWFSLCGLMVVLLWFAFVGWRYLVCWLYFCVWFVMWFFAVVFYWFGLLDLG